MDMKKWVFDYIGCAQKKAMPVLSFPGIQLTGDTVRDVVCDTAAQVRCVKSIAAKYDMAAALGPMDLSVEAEAFGCEIRFSDDEVPTVISPILDIEKPESITEMLIPPVGAGRTGVYIDAVKILSEEITDRPVFSGMIGPFSLACRLLDMSEVMMACVDEPDLLDELLERVTDFLCDYARALKSAGASGVVIAEPAAGLLSPGLNAEFSVPYFNKIVSAVQNDNFIVVYHNCGPYTPKQIGNILDTGARVFHFGDAIDLDDLKDYIPDTILLSGNVSPVGNFRSGTPEETRAATLDVLNKCGKMSNFIPSSGCDIPPMSKFENIDSFFQTVSDFYNENVK